MKRKIKYYRLVWLKYDLPAGMSVFFVAIPLCLGIALASGAPIYSGLLSGIIGGVLVSMISGSQLSVSGPAAGMSTVVAASIISLGDYRVFLVAVIIAGLFQLILGLMKLGGIANYFPSSVIKGMLAAIGIILISKQIPLVLGYDQPDFWTSGFPQLFSDGHFFGNIKNFNFHLTRGSIFITTVSLAVLIILQQSFAKKLKILPSALLVVIFGIIANYIFSSLTSNYQLKETQLVHIPANLFQNIMFPDFSKTFTNPNILKYGIIIGLLASLETLLCVEAIDKLDKHNRITPVNRELVAQGIGNIACGLLGAIPLTAVVVRGAANVDAGGRTKMSAFTHGIFILIAVLLLPFLLNMIPLASLATILLITGFNLTKPKLFKNMYSLGWKQFLPFIITIIVILSTDLLIGVSIGLILSIYFIVRENFKVEYKITESVENNQKTFLLKLNSNVSFLNKVNLKKALDKIPENSILTIDGHDCNFIDYDILEIISEFGNKADDREIVLNLEGIKKVNVNAVH
jgi:MFS superfamily sulfate permease-like transporter